jgi:nicotinamidase-related amidase
VDTAVGKGTGASPRSKSVADVRHKSLEVVLFIDAINHFEFPDGTSLLRQSLQIAPNLVRLKERAYRAKVPVVYVNDNFGQWRSERCRLIEYCLRPESPGREFVRQVAPTECVSAGEKRRHFSRFWPEPPAPPRIRPLAGMR